MKTFLPGKTKKNVIFVFLAVVMLVSVQAGITRADLIDITNPYNLNPFATINVSDSYGNMTQYGYGSVWDPVSQPGFIDDTTWAFTPDTLSVNTASSSQGSYVTYTGSSLTAGGSGSVSTESTDGSAHSSFHLWFTPSVDANFHLWGALLGYGFQEGSNISGMVGLDAFPSGSPWYTIYINRDDEGAIVPAIFDLTGQLYAGTTYHFTIGADASTQDNPTGVDWNFNLDMQTSAPVPEPATMLLLGSGLVGLAGLRIKRKKN